MKRKGIGSHTKPNGGATVSWLTPPEIVTALGPFDLDPCPCLPQPFPTAARVIEGDGLEADWDGRVWMNPPYGRALGSWLRRLAFHGNGIAISFARTETLAFSRYVWGHASGLLFLHGRLHFYRPDGTRAKGNAGGPSVLIAYGKDNAERLMTCGLQGSFVTEVER